MKLMPNSGYIIARKVAPKETEQKGLLIVPDSMDKDEYYEVIEHMPVNPESVIFDEGCHVFIGKFTPMTVDHEGEKLYLIHQERVFCARIAD